MRIWCVNRIAMPNGQRWKHGVIKHEAGGVTITVTPPRTGLDPLMVCLHFLMACGFCGLAFSGTRSTHSLILARTVTLLFLGVSFFFLSRFLFERQLAVETVTVEDDKISWTRKTRWWTRERQRNTKDVTDIFADTGWIGLGQVRLTTKWQRYTLFSNVINEDAPDLPMN